MEEKDMERKEGKDDSCPIRLLRLCQWTPRR